VLLVRDDNEHPDTRAIVGAVEQTCDRLRVPWESERSTGGHPLEQLAELVALMDFASVYAALMQHRDPSRSAEDLDWRFGRGAPEGGKTWNS
jgi:hypothetical protein